VRLATCVAIELGVGASVVAALTLAGVAGMAELRAGFSREARAARMPGEPRAAHLPAELPAVVDVRRVPREQAPPLSGAPRPTAIGVAGGSGATRSAEPAPLASPPQRPGEGSFVGQPDRLLLEPLRTGRLASVKFNRGGSSLSLRIDFDNGARAAFKPDQVNLQTVPRKEVAAYRIARLLGIDRVAPAIGARFLLEDIHAHLRPDALPQWPRFVEQVTVQDGWVVGELSHWIPIIEDAKIDGFPIDQVNGVVTWKRALTIGHPIGRSEAALVAQVSDMVVFDYVINNSDRWSGSNTKASEGSAALYFMDNALSFGNDRRGHSRVRTYFERSQKFSRRLVAALRAVDEAAVRAAVSWDVEPFDVLLEEGEIAALMARRAAVLAAIDRLIATHGEKKVLVFP
jgi:hypothetical protein